MKPTHTTHYSLFTGSDFWWAGKSQSTCFVVAFNVYKSAMFRFCAEIPGPRAGVSKITTYLSTVRQ